MRFKYMFEQGNNQWGSRDIVPNRGGRVTEGASAELCNPRSCWPGNIESESERVSLGLGERKERWCG